MVDFTQRQQEREQKIKEQEEKSKLSEPKEKSRKKFRAVLNGLERYILEEIEFDTGEATYSVVEITDSETGTKLYIGSSQSVEAITLKAVQELTEKVSDLESRLEIFEKKASR